MATFTARSSLVVFVLVLQCAAIHALGLVPMASAQTPHESVTGHVEFVAANGNQVRYSVSAIRHRDGSVSGEFEIHVDSPTGQFVLRSHVAITCFTVAGNVARIGGVVDRSSGVGAPPGTEGFITVVDNGQGKNDPADLASPTGIGAGTATAHCLTGLPRLLFPVERGNIQVRPAGS